MRWETLKAISESSLGRLAFVVPFLPFIIDILGVLTGPLESFANLTNFAEPVRDWFLNNREAVVVFYIGLASFVIGSILFNIFAPKSIKEFSDHDAIRRSIMNDKKLAIQVRENEYARVLSDRLEQVLEMEKIQDDEKTWARLFITFFFALSIFCLVTPPVVKFITISLEYLFI